MGNSKHILLHNTCVQLALAHAHIFFNRLPSKPIFLSPCRHVHLLHRSPANCMIVNPFITMFLAHLKLKMSPMDINLVILGTCREEHGTEGYSGSNEDYGCRLLIYISPKEIRVYPTASSGHCSWIAQLCRHIRHRICLKRPYLVLSKSGRDPLAANWSSLDCRVWITHLYSRPWGNGKIGGEWRTGVESYSNAGRCFLPFRSLFAIPPSFAINCTILESPIGSSQEASRSVRPRKSDSPMGIGAGY